MTGWSLPLLVLLLAGGPDAPSGPPEPWLAALRPRKVDFHPTTETERQVFASLVPKLLQAAARGGPLPPGATEAAARAHFRLETWRSGGEHFWLLLEQPEHHRGAGAYAFRVVSADAAHEERAVLLQTPHGQYDQGTEELGARLFFSPGAGPAARALFSSTLHRYRSRPDEKRTDEEHPADVAHAPTHLFQTATTAVVSTLGAVDVVQLHGFGEHRKSLADVGAVVSSGLSTHSTHRVAELAEALRPWLGAKVHRYPEDTRELGATRNVQGQLVNILPHAHFIHLELSAPVRRELLSSEEARARLAEALFHPRLPPWRPDAGGPP
jgi:hypothetical protein